VDVDVALTVNPSVRATGPSFAGVTAIETVAAVESVVPSLTLNVKLSAPT
jgi:hypothetical protein